MSRSARTARPARRRKAIRALAVACSLVLLDAAAALPDDPPGSRAELARGKLLVASAGLVDPNFRETVVLLLEHDATGALGVVINRPSDLRVSVLLPEVAELAEREDKIFLGGPVGRDRMVILVRTASPPAASAPILDGVFVTAELGVLRELAVQSSDTERFRIYVGFAGWAAQQLEAEVWRTLHERSSGQWVGLPPPLRLAAAR